MAELKIENLTKRFGESDGNEVVAVEDLTLKIEDTEFMVIVGPSGCGKTTTLRSVAGLEEASEGEIKIDDEVINGKKAKDRDVAMVFQSYALYPHMTVRENMGFGLKYTTDFSKDEVNNRVEEVAELLDIEELLERYPKELSGGQQQRVALGRAIVRSPKVFLMDEPLSNLDAKLRSEMRTELQRLQEDLEITTMYVTHDQTEAMTMGDKIAILNDGKLQQVGTPLECYHEPENLFVAGFIGEPSMNFFETEKDGDTLVAEGFEYKISKELEEKIGDTTNVTIGIRPEDIELHREEVDKNDFRSSIEVVEPMGKENNVHLNPESSNVWENYVAIVPGSTNLKEGEIVFTHIPESKLHVFNTDTGEAIRNRNLDEIKEAEVRY